MSLVLLYSFKPILEYIDAQFEKYLEEELKIKRSLFSCHDTRIHACLYFIAPSGHSLKSLDLVTMKKLDSKVTSPSLHRSPLLCPTLSSPLLTQTPAQVNIIPVIAKADTVNRSELDKLKIKIMSELVSNGVQIYQFPTEDEAVAEINSSMNVSPSEADPPPFGRPRRGLNAIGSGARASVADSPPLRCGGKRRKRQSGK